MRLAISDAWTLPVYSISGVCVPFATVSVAPPGPGRTRTRTGRQRAAAPLRAGPSAARTFRPGRKPAHSTWPARTPRSAGSPRAGRTAGTAVLPAARVPTVCRARRDRDRRPSETPLEELPLAGRAVAVEGDLGVSLFVLVPAHAVAGRALKRVLVTLERRIDVAFVVAGGDLGGAQLLRRGVRNGRRGRECGWERRFAGERRGRRRAGFRRLLLLLLLLATAGGQNADGQAHDQQTTTHSCSFQRVWGVVGKGGERGSSFTGA